MFIKTLTLTILVVFVFNICAPLAARAGLVSDFLLDEAVEYYRCGNIKEALQALKKILLIEPRHKEALQLRARIFSEQDPRSVKEEKKQQRLRREAAELLDEIERKRQRKLEAEEEEAPVVVREEAPAVAAAVEETAPQVEKRIPAAVEEAPAAVEVPAGEPAASRWIARVRPKKIITSEELEGYRLFTEARVFIDGRQLKLAPVIIKENDIRLPLEQLARALDLVTFSAQEDTLTLINQEGLPLEFNVGEKEVLVSKKPHLVMAHPLAIYENSLMLELDSLRQVLGISFEYSAAANAIEVLRKKPPAFSTFTIAKPRAVIEEEKIEEEKRLKARARPSLPREMRQELLPAEYYPDIDFKLESDFRYYHDMFEDKRTRYTEHYLRGRMYDFDVYGHLSMRDYESDDKRTFKEDGQHLSFFRKGTGVKLLDNYFRLPALRAQTQSYWGIEIDSTDMPIKSYAWMGEADPVYTSALEGGRSVKYEGNIYALRQDWIDTEQFRLSAVELFTHSRAELSEDAGASNYPRKNFVYLLDSDWQIRPGINFYNTFAQSIYKPDNKHDVTVSDYDFKSGVRLNLKRLRLNSSFEYVGDRYASLGIPATYQDYIGWDLSTSFKMTDYLNLNVSGNLNRDNVDFDDDRVSSHNKGLTAGTNLRLPWDQNLNFGWDYNRHLTRGGAENASGDEYNSYRIDYYKTLGTASFQLGWQHYRMDPLASNTGSMFFDTYSATIYKNFPQLHGSYLRLYQDMTKKKELSRGDSPSTRTLNTNLSGRYYVSPKLSLIGDCRLSNIHQDQTDDTTTLSLSAGAEYNLFSDTTLNCSYEASNIDLTEQWSADDWSILLYVRHVFDIRTAEKWGRVLVSVFEDENGNNIKDAREQGLKDVLAYIVKGRGTKTNYSGEALIEQIVPGKREVRLNMRDLPADMIIKGALTQEVELEPLETEEVVFVVVTAGTIQGRIFVDTDNNGIFDKDIDLPLPNIRIFLSPGAKDTLSFSDGSYRFEYAYPGPRQVHIDTEWAPEEYRLISPQAQDVEVKSKETLENIDFLFRGRPLKIKYF
jgi:hypothetical protein